MVLDNLFLQLSTLKYFAHFSGNLHGAKAMQKAQGGSRPWLHTPLPQPSTSGLCVARQLGQTPEGATGLWQSHLLGVETAGSTQPPEADFVFCFVLF